MRKKILFTAIDFFSSFFNPGRMPVCRFEPSCSVYAKDALSRRTFFAAAALIVKRLLRCRPFSAFGYDPVTGPSGK